MNDKKIIQLLAIWEQVEKGLLERAETKQKEPYTSMAKTIKVCIGDLKLALEEDIRGDKTIKGDIIG